jgi:hypothetical protein
MTGYARNGGDGHKGENGDEHGRRLGKPEKAEGKDGEQNRAERGDNDKPSQDPYGEDCPDYGVQYEQDRHCYLVVLSEVIDRRG